MNRFRNLQVSLICAVLLLAGCERVAEQGTLKTPDAEAIIANNRGVGLMGRFDYEAARAVFATLSDDYPGEPAFRTNLGIALMNRQLEGDEAEALALFQALLEEGPENLRARYCAGLLEFRRGELARAAAHLEEVLKQDPDDAYAAYFLGQTLQQQARNEDAVHWYRRVLETDPYLRSAYYALSQLYRQLGQSDAARQHIGLYQKLANNPRAQLIEFKYLRMGPRCEASTISPVPDRPVLPDGLLFAGTRASLMTLLPEASRTTAPPSLSVVDINADGRPDLFVAGAATFRGAANSILLGQADGSFLPDPGHPLVGISGVNAVLWGDYDNDGQVDVYLCRAGGNQLWRQAGPDDWVNVTEATGTANGNLDSVDGAFFDADHDGDLDILVINRDGPNELLNNNLDGSFRPLAGERGLAGGPGDSRSVLLLDLDRDRDTDLVMFNAIPPHAVYLNDLMWNYRPASGFEALVTTPVSAAVSGDQDGDGIPEIYTLDPEGDLLRWQLVDGSWSASPLGAAPGGSPLRMELRDFNGDGRSELLVVTTRGWAVHALTVSGLKRLFGSEPDRPLRAMASIVMDTGHGPSLVLLDADAALKLWPPGKGRHPFIGLALSGLDDNAGSMRSNASGIGSQLALRTGSRWILTDTFRHHSGPGQDLQPVVVGLGGARQLDFAAVTWSDGVYQTELGLETGRVHRIVETQRQLSSCPVLFAWDGARHAFISDLLGVGGIGYLVEPGVYAPPRPRENFLIPKGALEPLRGQYVLKLGEPMEEAAYFDALQLVSYDLPPGWDLVLDERMNILGPEPTGEVIYFREQRLPQRATTVDGRDVTGRVRTADLEAPPVGEPDRRFIGRLREPQQLTLEFESPLDRPGARPVLVIDGWVEYPYSQTMFAAWQAQADYRAPTLEARDTAGRWHTLLEQFGYPAGMPRRMALPLPDLPAGTDALRLTTNQEIYWDRVAVVYAEPLPGALRTELPLQHAEVRESGFARRTTGPQRQPHYDYERRSPSWDTRHLAGHYTAFGPATELVNTADDALAIIGPGEELHLEYSAQPPALPSGWTRRFVFETRGWAKDMDLYTGDGNTLEPLPSQGRPGGRRAALHARYNTRYRSGI